MLKLNFSSISTEISSSGIISITSSGNWTVPEGVYSVHAFMVGGGVVVQEIVIKLVGVD
jgi:hypothetical protein